MNRFYVDVILILKKEFHFENRTECSYRLEFLVLVRWIHELIQYLQVHRIGTCF